MTNTIRILLALLLFPASSIIGEENPTIVKLHDCHPITSKDLHNDKAPIFEQFPAQEATGNWVPADKSTNPKAAKYKTELSRATVGAPNFAGFYSVVAWGCGSSCTTFAIVNRKTGRVIFPDPISNISGVHLNADDFLSNANPGNWGLRFQLNSRLLVLVGAINENENREGAFYYVIENDHLKPVFSMRVEKQKCN
jgi:hypothetical protein